MVAIFSSLLFVALAALLVLLPVPYVAWRPGQTVDVLANTDDSRVIDIGNGTPNYPTSGKLLMTTVSSTRVDSTLSLAEAALVYLRDDSDAMPRDAIYPPGLSTTQVKEGAERQMDSSLDSAKVAALRAAGVTVTEKVQVLQVSGPSQDKLLPDDIIKSVNGTEVSSYDEIKSLLEAQPVGEPVTFVVQRIDEQLTVQVDPEENKAGADRAGLGLIIGLSYDYEPVVNISIDRAITGPSAGLIFALGLYDRITERSLLNGRTVAGTGVIDPNGSVSQVGGVWQKIKAAERDGASVFLVPADNCAAVASMKTNLMLIRVKNLKDAISALQQLQEDNLAEVPTCD